MTEPGAARDRGGDGSGGSGRAARRGQGGEPQQVWAPLPILLRLGVLITGGMLVSVLVVAATSAGMLAGIGPRPRHSVLVGLMVVAVVSNLGFLLVLIRPARRAMPPRGVLGALALLGAPLTAIILVLGPILWTRPIPTHGTAEPVGSLGAEVGRDPMATLTVLVLLWMCTAISEIAAMPWVVRLHDGGGDYRGFTVLVMTSLCLTVGALLMVWGLPAWMLTGESTGAMVLLGGAGIVGCSVLVVLAALAAVAWGEHCVRIKRERTAQLRDIVAQIQASGPPADPAGRRWLLRRFPPRQ